MKLLQLLHAAQHEDGYLSETRLRQLAQEANVPLYRLQELVSFYPHFRTAPPPRVELLVCRDVACQVNGAEACLKELQALAPADAVVREVSCIGRCDAAPVGLLNELPVHLSDTAWIATGLQHPEQVNPLHPEPFRPCQTDPYITLADRYSTVKGLSVIDADTAAEQIVEQLTASGLRGMGGAGFPTGLKWAFVRKESRGPKTIICNADESEPGTFKDAFILRHLPHLVIEGMCLAALTVRANRGIIFLRHEYEYERQAIADALIQARQQGVIGVSVGFDIELLISPGGYILGEETALLECLEDKRGEPRNKPPFPGSQGLQGLPTLINNVETFAHVPRIVRHGAAAWKALGKPGYAGLKFVAVSGHVARPGVYEVPLGTTLRELLAQAGGMLDQQELLAILPGGASSNILPAAALDTPLDFTAMQQAGSMLGSGAVLFFAEGTDLLAVAANITRFFRNESCGKCVPCRVGSEKAVAILDGVRAGTRPALQLQLLPELGSTMAQTSICGLGQVAVAPALSILKQWPELAKASPLSQESSS